MYSRERVVATLQRERTDRPPWIEIGFHPSIMEKISGRSFIATGSGFFPISTDLEWKAELDRWVELAVKIGLDGVALKNWGVSFPSELGHQMEGGTLKSIEAIDRIIERRPSFIKPGFIENAEYLKKRCHESGLAVFYETHFGIGPAINSIGFADFCTFAIDDPTIILRFWDYFAEGLRPVIELFHQLEPDFLVVGDDIAFGQGTYLSPTLMRELVFPHFATMAELITLPWIYHSDGNLIHVFEDLLLLGMKAIHPIEPYGTMDIESLKQTHGDRIVLAGNLDMNLIANGTPDEIAAEVVRIFDAVGRGGGWILSSSNSIDSGASPENVVAMGRTISACLY